jgi:radical S-adenosyl methionine domain-containing protein 2
MCRLVHDNGMGLKINTTVTRLNYSEDMRPFISSLSPARWKIFQMLAMKGQNSDALDLLLNDDEFEMFRDINKGLVLSNGAAPTFESTDDMLESYLIIGSDGNILLSKGNQRATIPFEEMYRLELEDLVDVERYLERGGDYDYYRKIS